MLNKKWYQNNVKERKDLVKSAQKDVDFAMEQMAFWKQYYQDAKERVVTYSGYLEEAEKQLKEYKR